MFLELHIWGAAFGLPSIDPECLAAVAYLSLAAPRSAWSVVATSPSAIPHALPALRDARTGRWLAAGFESLVAFVRARAQAQAQAVSSSSSSSFTDLDAGLTPTQVADATAYAAFLRAEAAPLLALSLYVSSANWVATTRPAYSRILPFPLTWIEPPAVRASHAAGATHLGFSSLDTDSDANDDDNEPRESSSLAAALHSFPDRIRKSVQQQQQQQNQNQTSENATSSSGSSNRHKPAAQSLTIAAAASRVSQALTPEAKAHIRLDEAARACLSVLAQQKGSKRSFLRGGGEGNKGGKEVSFESQLTTSLDCLAFGYLALMTVPDVPRPFLRDALRRHHHDLAVFVADMRQACFGTATEHAESAPSSPSALTLSASPRSAVRYANPLWLRTLHGIVHSVPGLSGEWMVWLWRQIRVDDESDNDENDKDVSAIPWRRDAAVARLQRLVAVSSTLAGTALVVGLVLGYRRLPAFGSRIVVYRRGPMSFAGLGAAGALLSIL